MSTELIRSHSPASSSQAEKMDSRPLIAVDFDDVLVATNEAAAKWHNREYGTSLDLGDFLYYHWWKNPGWGTINDTVVKVTKFYDSDDYINAPPIPGAARSCKILKERGYRLVIVTARSDEHRQITEDAIRRYFPDIFENIYFTVSLGRRGSSYLSKPQILASIGAMAFIDDSLDNAMDCARAGFPSILFGQYMWNQRTSKIQSPTDRMGFAERQQMEYPRAKWWEIDDLPDRSFPPNLRRASNWDTALKVVESFRRC
ncbi:hypothetical protein FRC03_010104 [Tulasnella sp. 419]|nr:hypothetical protein FRC03_010104 [Tulasnella sp. 419]